jgi:UDP-N-acetylmuramate dehydrogenase
MKFLEKISLSTYSTMKTGGVADYFGIIGKEADIFEAIKFAKEKKLKVLVLGGGSNVLISDSPFSGLVLKIEIGGLKYEESDNEILVEAGAGVHWDELVKDSVSKGFFGLENLSLIPGTVGASPVQNIGAYGKEVKDFIKLVEAIDFETGEKKIFSNKDCGFSYRDSIFKKPGMKKFIITKVVFRLFKNGGVDVSYKDLAKYFENFQGLIDGKSVRDVVIKIRTEKMPDLSKWGTLGSFWKNPIVSNDTVTRLKERFPEMPVYGIDNGTKKISLAWLLDRALHLKGYEMGNVGLYKNQPLVIVSKKNTSTEEVFKFADFIERKVFDEIGIEIDREVEYIG